MSSDRVFNGEALRRIRLERGLSQAQLAELVGVTDAAVCLIENGHRKRPRPSTAKAIADALRTDISDLWSAA